MNNYCKLPTEDKRMVLQLGTWTRDQRLAKYLFLWKRFFEKLSLDLRNEFSGQEGYSVTNLRHIKNWYTFYSQCDTMRSTKMPQ